MKTTRIAQTAAYIGAGAGLALFVLFGLLPGSLLGGAAGIKTAGLLLGLPLEAGLLSRTVVLLSMLMGIAASGVVVVTATSTAAWLVGRLAESAVQGCAAEAKASM